MLQCRKKNTNSFLYLQMHIEIFCRLVDSFWIILNIKYLYYLLIIISWLFCTSQYFSTLPNGFSLSPYANVRVAESTLNQVLYKKNGRSDWLKSGSRVFFRASFADQ